MVSHMRHVAAALAFASTIAVVLAASPAHAQVVISGQVTSYTAPAGPTTSGPSSYVAAEPAPTRYIHRSANIPALWVPGIILLGAGWVANVAGIGVLVAEEVGARIHDNWYLYGLIPVLGPWLQFAEEPNGLPEWSIVTGVVQLAGLVMFILGLTLQEEWDEPVYVLDENNPMSPRISFNLETAPGGGAIGTATLTHF